MKSTRSASSDSSTSESSASSSSAVRNTGATLTTQEVKQKLVQNTPAATTAAVTPRTRPVDTSSTTATPEKKPFQSRFLPNHQQEKKEETESSSEEETSSEESEEEEEEVPSAKPTVVTKPATVTPISAPAVKNDIGSLLTRSTQARETQADNNRRNSRDETNLRSSGGYSSPTYNRSYEKEASPKYTSAVRTRPTRDQYDEPKYGSSTGSSG